MSDQRTSAKEREQKLIDAVARALWRMEYPRAQIERGLPAWWLDMGRAAIAAVRDHECCSSCGESVKPPTLCDRCVAIERRLSDDRTPEVATDPTKTT